MTFKEKITNTAGTYLGKVDDVLNRGACWMLAYIHWDTRLK